MWQEAYKRLAGLITFASPLDKIASYFREQTALNAHIRRHMLNNLHSFKKIPLNDPDIDYNAHDYVDVKDETLSNLSHAKWINFHDSADPVSGRLDLYSVDKNKLLKMNKAFGIAHTAYWEHPEMYEEILEFFKDTIVREENQQS